MTDKPYLNPDYCTRNDAARLAGVTVLTISNWIKSGRIRAVTLDGRVYVERSSLPMSVKVETLGSRLKYARRDKRLTATDVGQALGISRFTLSKYEADEREVPPERLSKLATLYGVSVKWLVGENNDSAQWRESHLEEISARAREQARKWKENNPDWMKKRDRQGHEANPDHTREMNSQRRARIKGVVHAVPANIVEILFDIQNGHCMYCHCELLNGYHLDHIVPLALVDLLGDQHPGHTPSNLCLACGHCNISKNDKMLESWLAQKYPDQMDEILQRVERHIKIMREWE